MPQGVGVQVPERPLSVGIPDCDRRCHEIESTQERNHLADLLNASTQLSVEAVATRMGIVIMDETLP